MAILAFLISIEEVARELPAASEGTLEVTLGNVVGSVFPFFLMNGGIIALVRPLPVEEQVLTFHLLFAFGTALIIAVIMIGRGSRAGPVRCWS